MDNENVYNKYNWEEINIDHLRGKISRILEWIPDDVETILDVGCGNGVITNILGEKYKTTGVDRSEVALQTVRTEKILASADSIPLSDKSFDMVFSSELLEHLDDNFLPQVVYEMTRLSKKYLFITVPNDENPNKLSIQCPECSYIYNKPNHLRSFTADSLAGLFPEHIIKKQAVIGKKVRYYNRTLLHMKKKLTPSSSWIPEYWIEKSKRNTVCPNCENEFVIPYTFHPLSFAIDLFNVVRSPKKPYWLMVLMEKKNQSLQT